MRAECVWFSPTLGYGFLRQEGVTKETFVHQSDISMVGFRKLSPGQTVSYTLGSHHGQVCAVDVEPMARAKHTKSVSAVEQATTPAVGKSCSVGNQKGATS